ncbi:unnamed protein product [Lampetra planeri]
MEAAAPLPRPPLATAAADKALRPSRRPAAPAGTGRTSSQSPRRLQKGALLVTVVPLVATRRSHTKATREHSRLQAGSECGGEAAAPCGWPGERGACSAVPLPCSRSPHGCTWLSPSRPGRRGAGGFLCQPLTTCLATSHVLLSPRVL